MPKFQKKQKKKGRENQIPEARVLLRTVRISAVIAGIFFVLSLIFNGTELFFEGIITHYYQGEDYWVILDYTIKITVIILEFLFMMISLGSYKELTGKPVNLKEILFLLGLCLLQTIRSLIVFIFALIGLGVILFYLFLIQES